MPYEALFCDSGGTLFGRDPGTADPGPGDVAAGTAARTAQALRWLGYAVDDETVAARMECVAHARQRSDPTWTEERAIAALFQQLDLAPRPDHVVWVTGVASGPRFASWLFPGVAAALQRLQDAGVALGLVANTTVPGWVMDRNLRGVGLLRFFPVRLYSGDEGVAKPDPEIFHRAARRAGLEGRRLAYIGDRVDKDVEGAGAAGWTSILFRSSQATSGGRADHEVDAWDEVPGLLLDGAA